MAACGGDDDGGRAPARAPARARPASSARRRSRQKLKIGVKADQPGLGLQTGSTYEGFDIEIAKIIAKGLGIDGDEHRVRDDGVGQPRAVHPAGHGRPRGRHVHHQRRAQAEGQLRRAVLRRRPGPARPDRLDDHRPGQLGRQEGLLGHRLDAGQADQGGLPGRRSCSCSTRTPSASTALAGGQVDAVTTDDIILAGYASQRSTRASSRWSARPFTEEPYGIGVKKDDKAGCDKINEILKAAGDRRRYKAAWDATLGTSGNAGARRSTPAS